MEVAVMSTIIRWNPLREMAEMQNSMYRLFDDTWRSAWPSVESNFALPIDVYESDQGYTIVANIPGVAQDDINLTLNQNVLNLGVEVPQYTPAEGQRSLVMERAHGHFNRSITLPRPVNSEQIEAVYDNGVLTLNLPLAPEAQPKRISVKGNGALLQSNN
jgi:HSP20 family protein